MIYLDNSATSLVRPPEVAAAMVSALEQCGNPGRSFYEISLMAGRYLLAGRQELATLAGLGSPLSVAFTSSATESLNLVIGSLLSADSHVITTALEHNSVLRPLYRTGCSLTILPFDSSGTISPATLANAITPQTTHLVCTHGSNVLGSVLPLAAFHTICQRHGILLIADISQTFGAIPVDGSLGDILCFTGHKSLFGPQGTGGILVPSLETPLVVAKTGGTGFQSFAPVQPATMPDCYEAGTPNTPGIHGLAAGVRFVRKTGISAISAHTTALTHRFLEQIGTSPRIHCANPSPQLPVVSLSVEGYSSQELSFRLWEEYGIAVRSGSHCAPLVHQQLHTTDCGLTRFSFSYYTTPEEVDSAAQALLTISQGDSHHGIHSNL